MQSCGRSDGTVRCQRRAVELLRPAPAMRSPRYGQRHRVGGRLAGLRRRRSRAGGQRRRDLRRRRRARATHDRTPNRRRRQLPRPAGAGPEQADPDRVRRDPGAEPRRTAASLRLAVRTPVRLRVSAASGHRRRRAGRLLRLGRPRRGRRSPRRPARWRCSSGSATARGREFRTVQTDARGRFRYPYSFSDDDSRGVRFQFRAIVPRPAGLALRAAGSRAASASPAR